MDFTPALGWFAGFLLPLGKFDEFLPALGCFAGFLPPLGWFDGFHFKLLSLIFSKWIFTTTKLVRWILLWIT